MATDETHRARARDAINAARRGHLPKLKYDSSMSTPPTLCSSVSVEARATNSSSKFETAQENSIEVYDDKFGRNTILTRSARMRKFKFYQYKPVQESPSGTTPATRTGAPTPTDSRDRRWAHESNGNAIRSDINGTHSCSTSSIHATTPKGPLLLPRDDVLQGRVSLVVDEQQSKELCELDDEIAELERKIADLNMGGNTNSEQGNNVDNLDEVFALVNKKNDLLRRQMQLNIIEQEKVLEKANEELTKELRDLMSIDDSRKSKSQLERQQYLYDQSLALVNKRNELVHHMDVQERGIEDDNALKATLKHVISAPATRHKLRGQNKSHQDQNCIIQ